MSRIDFDAINAAARANFQGLIRDWIPGGRLEGDEYTAGDFQGGKGRSVRINVKKCSGGDFAANKLAGDPIGIYAIVFGVDRTAAARAIAGILGIEGGETGQQHTRQLYAPVPQQDDTDSDADKIAKVGKLLADTAGVRGTAAETYLRSRGLIGAPKGTIAWLPDKRVRGAGALVCIAHDSAGTPVAVQRIALTANGEKDKTKKVIKRTNGVVRGSAMMLPGKQPGTGPLLLTEGPEDGLTLRQATGMDTAVAFGIFALAHVPVDEGRPVIFVRDNDEPGSDADKAVSRVVERLLDRNINLLMTRPPDGVKDSNDLLRAIGPDAIVDMINDAMPVRDRRFDPPEPEDTPPAPPPPEPDEGTVVNMPAPEFQECSELPPTDTGNAQRIVKRWGSILMNVPGIGWHIYSKGVWDAGLADMRVLKMAQVTAQDIQQEASFLAPPENRDRLKWCLKSQMGGQIMYAIKLAAPYVSRGTNALDADPWLFNCVNGVVDLRTGLMQQHNPLQYITKQAPVEYHKDAKCPVWEKMLREIFEPNPDIIPFVQRSVGYSLTGDISEQCMFIAHGYGSNGKSTFLETLQAIIGPYWAKTQAETFAAKDRQAPGAPNPAVAALRGARFVTASETNEGLRLDEGLVKEVTGDAFITVRNLHQAPFTFRPSFKVWLGTNHKPEVRGTDHGIWRRLKLIPFNATFYENNDPDAPQNGPFKDKTLPAKLRCELPGILAWAVRGSMMWAKSGLDAPQSIQAATLEYRSEMDVLGAFVGEALATRPGSNVPFSELYGAYTKWASDNGHGAMSKKKLSAKLRERGMKTDKDGYGQIRLQNYVIREGFGGFDHGHRGDYQGSMGV